MNLKYLAVILAYLEIDLLKTLCVGLKNSFKHQSVLSVSRSKFERGNYKIGIKNITA